MVDIPREDDNEDGGVFNTSIHHSYNPVRLENTKDLTFTNTKSSFKFT